MSIDIREMINKVIGLNNRLNENVGLGQFTQDDVFQTILNNEFDWYDLYPEYSEPFDEDEEYMFDTKEQAEHNADFVIGTLGNLPNPIPIYRALHAKDEKSIDLDYLGESWSMYRESAISFGSHNNSNFLISGTIDKQFVNWDETLKRFVVYSGGGDADDENEVVVDDTSQVKNIKITPLQWKKKIT